jgi:hypothetical protein
MRLYLDDDSADPLLVRLLRHAGHDVQIPADIGKSGHPDPFHLQQAILTSRVFLSGNHDDFDLLHNLVLAAQGHHAGILIVRRDNNPKKDLSPGGIVRAIHNLLNANVPLIDCLHILNHWRSPP